MDEATGALTKLDGNTVYLSVSKVVDPKSRADKHKKEKSKKNDDK